MHKNLQQRVGEGGTQPQEPTTCSKGAGKVVGVPPGGKGSRCEGVTRG